VQYSARYVPVLIDVGIEPGQVNQFFEWLQDGVQKGSLRTNQAKARIHKVDEGVI